MRAKSRCCFCCVLCMILKEYLKVIFGSLLKVLVKYFSCNAVKDVTLNKSMSMERMFISLFEVLLLREDDVINGDLK